MSDRVLSTDAAGTSYGQCVPFLRPYDVPRMLRSGWR